MSSPLLAFEDSELTSLVEEKRQWIQSNITPKEIAPTEKEGTNGFCATVFANAVFYNARFLTWQAYHEISRHKAVRIPQFTSKSHQNNVFFCISCFFKKCVTRKYSENRYVCAFRMPVVYYLV